ncbi:hypothetical protein [Mesorhizobium sp.]|uniref:hypothetical protein n=1 Tax=Mesorhizobium sp. TaxID=1871066 RepID=UPI002580C0B4|nr:hypothetical protein [Mesorhizobium sp.]
MVDQKGARLLKRLANVPQDPPARPRIDVQLGHGRTLAPPLVRARRHPMDELGGLHLLELCFALGLRVLTDDHLHRQPCGDNTARVDVGLSQPRPSGLGAILR